jgi:hypothetical protein
MKMTVLWDAAQSSLVEIYRRFKGACSLHHQGDEEQHGRKRPNSHLSVITLMPMHHECSP